jgi:hypothetical protein
MKYLKRFNESKNYYDDDMNVDITSNIIDIVQDLIDDGLDIECFTDGYIKLKRDGIKSTDNDICLFISSNSDDGWIHDEDYSNYKTLNYKELLPYLQRVIDYIESEDRLVFIEFQWRDINLPPHVSYLRTMELEYRLFNGEVNKELGSIPGRNYDCIIMKFKLKL